ncbi:MAG: cation transporter [Oscillospiraceae bacterium]|nr:cation transporter [Oscillospiraceae bacterium]
MKTERNILVALVLNLSFAVFEFVGGLLTGSVAVISDAVHDLGDAASIAVSVILERKSKQQPDETYTYGYGRYSTLGGVITTGILIVGAVIVMFTSLSRVVQPREIQYDGMIAIAVVGVLVNGCAAFFTHGGNGMNQKAVNLHMLEDVLGWVVVLAGAVIMRFTDISVIDPLMSLGAALFILFHALKNMKVGVEEFLERVPRGITVAEIVSHVKEIEGVLSIHHVHLWSVGEHHCCATMHLVTDGEADSIKRAVREKLRAWGVEHLTIEIETSAEICTEPVRRVLPPPCAAHGTHHHTH